MMAKVTISGDSNDSDSNKDHSCAPLSWKDWLREHGNKLLLFARQQTRSLADAEDVLQDSLVKLSQKEAQGTFEGGQAAWLPYLYTTIRRCAIDLSRKEDRRSIREEKVEADKRSLNAGISDPWFTTNSADEETKNYLEQAIKQLPEKFAAVITLKIWGEQTFADVGKQLNISQNTAASRYRYGLEALKKHLASHKKAGNIL